MNWFVKVDGRIYGPYSDEAMQGFTAEGRIIAQSLITNNPSAGFYPAQSFDVFTFWSGTGQAKAATGGAAQYVQSNYAAQTEMQNPAQGPARLVMIMAQIRGSDGGAFYAALCDFGPVERIGDESWLVKTGASAEELRNRLSKTLGRADRLFIAAGDEMQAAWFNIGADLDKRIRQLSED